MVKEFAKECATPLPDKKKNRTLAPSLNEKIKLGKQPDTKAEKMSKDIISRGFMQPLSREKQIAERTRLETTHKYIMASHYLHEYETSRRNLNQSIKTKYDQQ